MTPGSIVVLVGTVALLMALAIVAAGTLALLWTFSRLRPHEELRAAVSELGAMVNALEAQVVRLRTQKAGARSAQKKAEAAREIPSEEEEDPFLAGLTEEDKALFR